MWTQTKDNICSDGNGQCTDCGRVVCTRDNERPKQCGCGWTKLDDDLPQVELAPGDCIEVPAGFSVELLKPRWQCNCCGAIVFSSDCPSECTCEPVVAFFKYSHLPEHLQKVSQPFWKMATDICDQSQQGPQRTLALTMLLQSKDAAVRAVVRPGG